MTETKKTTTPNASVGADAVQPLLKNSTNSITDSSNNCNLKTISMTELYDTVYPPRRPIVDNLLYSGTYLFVGAPKIGKSFFMGQLAYTVATGLPLWEYEVHQGTVLYLALEDDYARLQRRLSRMFGVEETDNLYFATQAKSVGGGLDEQLEEFVKVHQDVRLIIIDTLQKIREVSGECYSYASDYEIVTKLKKFSDNHGICLLVVHHTRKMEAGDSFDMISGTNGLLGAADGAFIMQKKRRTDNIATLDVVGRDQPDQELTLEFDRERCVWNFQGAETQLWKQPPDPVLEVVSKIFLSAGSAWCGTPTELLALLPDVKIQANVLTRKLNVSADRLYNDYGIRYESKRTHEGRTVCLTLEQPKARRYVTVVTIFWGASPTAKIPSPSSRPTRKRWQIFFFQQVAPQGAKALLIRSVKSAFALLLARVTEPCRLAPEIRSGFEKDNQCNGGKRLPQS